MFETRLVGWSLTALSTKRLRHVLQKIKFVKDLYCLSNTMHGQNINLHVCVCVSVCVSVTLKTLSVNSPTGQTPQRIFTVDSLTDADLCKGVPFGVSMMNNHT